MTTYPPRLASLALATVVIAAGLACEGCKGCRDDHPYVPYTIDDVPKAGGAEDASVPTLEDAGAFHAREASLAPPNAERWTLDGLGLVAPAERVFASGLTGDFDGDGARDAVALVTVAGDRDAGAATGEVVLYRGSPSGALGAPELIASPPTLPRDTRCAPKGRLAQVGRHTIAVELGTVCDPAGGGSGARWVAAVVVSSSGVRLHFRATVLDPPNAPALSIDVDGSDRDGDGLDDVAIRLALEGGAPPFEPGPRVSAIVRWFDRPAGMSRDPDEPDASLRGLASVAAVRAAKAKEAPGVPRYVEQVRSLYRALCAEGGSPRVVDLEGAHALQCGPSKGLEEAGLAEVRAYSVAGDALRAIGAFDRAQLPPATRTSQRTTDAQGWIAQAAPVLAAPSVLRALGAVPQIDRGRAPSWGVLAFEPSGKLLVRTVAGVVRVDPSLGDETAAGDVSPWRTAAVSPDGAYRWVESYDACDGLALRATFAPNAGGDMRDIALPVAPPLGSKCANAGAHGDPATTLPLAWGPRGLEAIVAGEPLLVSPDLSRATLLLAGGGLDQPVTLGAPRSPNGKVIVVPTTMGILVRGARSRLFRAKELEGGYLELRDCAVSDDGARVGCVRGGRAFVGVWEAE
ncbi:MAG: hypothetical protein ACLQVI_01230 [Polyangiaceae bacterium]|jgi:hypothetical protein